MKRINLLIISACCAISIFAQSQKKEETIVDKILQAIDGFQTREYKRDSALNHALGSNSEEDFLRRYTFYDSVYSILNTADKTLLSFDGQINLELIKYDLEDDLSEWKFKSYLNPILADEGFHTSLAAMGSQVLSSSREFENYIKRLKDIPRSVDERLTLMRKGLELGICQPRAILNGYENTYEQHIVTDIEKSVFWKPFLKKPFAITDADWKKITDEGRVAVQQYAVEGFKRSKRFLIKNTYPKQGRRLVCQISRTGWLITRSVRIIIRLLIFLMKKYIN
ncbi:MAG: DUF885 family protein [Bacteroidota bacterium]